MTMVVNPLRVACTGCGAAAGDACRSLITCEGRGVLAEPDYYECAECAWLRLPGDFVDRALNCPVCGGTKWNRGDQ